MRFAKTKGGVYVPGIVKPVIYLFKQIRLFIITGKEQLERFLDLAAFSLSKHVPCLLAFNRIREIKWNV